MKIIANINMGLQGRFKLTRIKASTMEIVEETPWFNNLILDQGMDRIGTGSVAGNCKVGTSNTPPATNQTALIGFLSGAGIFQSEQTIAQANPPYFASIIRKYRFATGVAAGTLAEVGVGWTNNNNVNTLFNRALILDINGNPTTITVFSDEILDVTYELRLYPDLIDKVFTTNISGIDYNCILRAASVTSNSRWGDNTFNGFAIGQFSQVYNGALGPITNDPSGSNANSTNNTLDAYVLGSYRRSFSTRWEITQGNLVGGITAWLMPTTLGSFKMSFSPAIPKDNTQTLTLAARVSWARYTP